MEFLKKYILLAFLLENIMAQTFLMMSVSAIVFYPFMFFGLFALVGTLNQGTEIFKKFKTLYLLMAVYIVYEFTIGLDYISQRTLLYLIAKLSTFGIIIVSIDSNEQFYRDKGIFILICSMAFFIGYGLITGDSDHGDERALVGFTNSNTTGAMGALIVGMLVFYLKDRKWNIYYGAIFVLGFYAVLAGGSRAGFLMLILLVFLRYGISVKTIGMSLLLLVLGLYILPAMGYHTIGIQRMMNTYNGVEGTNREVVREAAEWMIAQRPWTGWGFEAVNQGEAAKLTELGAHNGYLETMKQLGIPTAILYFLIIIITILKALRAKKEYHQPIDLYLALTLMLLIKANYEASFIGIHEYDTNIFFVSIAMVSSHLYNLKNNYLSYD